jgi:hypothetical protein
MWGKWTPGLPHAVFDITKSFIVAVELGSRRTLCVGQLPGDSGRCEFVMKYGF